MKLVFVAAIMLSAWPTFASHVYSTRVFTTDVRSEALPADLNFIADKIHVLNPGWYSSLFDQPGCERSLAERDLNTSLQITAADAHSMSIILNGRIAREVSAGKANYIPVYYKMGEVIQPHFVIKLKDSVLLHISIKKGLWGKKTLKIGLIQGRGENVHTVPILQATGR